MEAEKILVQLEKIHYKYNNAETSFSLQDIDLAIRQGDFFALFGEDDAGKTTLLQIILGYIKSSQGTCHVAESMKEIRYVPDSIFFDEVMTVKQYFSFQKKHSLHYNEEYQQDLMEVFGLEVQGRMVDLTYEQNKLVTIVGAISAEPKLLILDEPMNFLTDEIQPKVMKAFQLLNQSGTTILMTAERYDDISRCANRMAYLKNGKIAYSGECSEQESTRKKILRLTDFTGELMQEKGFVNLGMRENESIFLYCGEAGRLIERMGQCRYSDIHLDEMTWEEELEEDYTKYDRI